MTLRGRPDRLVGSEPQSQTRERGRIALASRNVRLGVSMPVVGAFAARGIALAAALSLSISVARKLPVAQAGSFFVCFAVVVLAATVGRLGTDTVLMRQIAGPGSTSRFWWRMLAVGVSGGLAAAVVVLIALPLAVGGDRATLEESATRAAIILSVVGASLSVISGAVLRASGALLRGILVETGIAPGVAVLIILATPGQSTLESALVAYAIGNLVACLLGLGAVARVFSPVSDAKVLWTGRGLAISMGSMMATATLFYAIVWAPLILMGFMGEVRAAALYSAAARLAGLVNIVPGVQATYLAPLLVKLKHGGDSVGASALCLSATKRSLLCALPIMAMATCLPGTTVGLFGESFRDATGALVVMACGYTLALAFGPVNSVLLSCGHERLAAVLNASLLAVMCLGILLVARGLGAVGAAAVTAFTLCLYNALASYYVWRRDNVRTGLFGRRIAGGRV